MQQSELISCVIPTHNRAAKLVQAIESILAQTYTEFEILVVDDQSADQTKQVVADMIKRDRRIKYFLNPNKGANNARNFGIQNASGKYIAFLDDDDVWMKSKLEKQLHVFRYLGPEYGVVYCTFARKKTSGKILKRHPSRFSPHRSGDILNFLLKRNFITTSTIFVRADVFKKSGMFDPHYKSFQDWELLTRIARDFQFYFLDEILVHVYESNDSITLDKKGRVLTKLKHLKQFMDLYSRHPRILSGRYSSLGFTLVKLGRWGFAGRFFRRSLKYNSLNAEALFWLTILKIRNFSGIK